MDEGHCSTVGHYRPAFHPGRLWRRLRGFAARLAQIEQRRRQRQALARLDARLLRDVGISVQQAAREVRKPLWRA
ncbi:MAG: DUF1127 domain-containing protein [Gammaproteobacteria bacterium]|nr:DUF1127 domain-containing protein [Gammaproteobacteria bacterium]